MITKLQSKNCDLVPGGAGGDGLPTIIDYNKRSKISIATHSLQMTIQLLIQFWQNTQERFLGSTTTIITTIGWTTTITKKRQKTKIFHLSLTWFWSDFKGRFLGWKATATSTTTSTIITTSWDLAELSSAQSEIGLYFD